MTNLTIRAETISVETTYNSRMVEAQANGLDLPDLLGQLDVDDLIQHFGAMELLDHLVEWAGRDEILEHLDVEEAP